MVGMSTILWRNLLIRIVNNILVVNAVNGETSGRREETSTFVGKPITEEWLLRKPIIFAEELTLENGCKNWYL